MSPEAVPPREQRHPLRTMRIVKSRPRLFLSAAIGLIATLFLFMTCDWRAATKLLVGWDTAVVIYLFLAIYLMARSDVHRIRRRAATQDEGQVAILALTVAAAIASLVAIFAQLGTTTGSARQAGHLILATGTIILSWAFIHSMFALHYAHEYYGSGRDGIIGGMTFPEDKEPDYWDFMYFAFTIGMCAQVSDVTVSSKSIRRTVLAHSIISFLFNAALLALTVNIAASAI
jgi:uncharacterized membrane protein